MDERNNNGSGRRANRAVALLSILCLFAFTWLYTHWQDTGTLSVWNSWGQSGDELTDGSYYSLYDGESGELLDCMTRSVSRGDQLLTGDNRHYQVEQVDGLTVQCQLLEERNLSQVLGQVMAVSQQPAAFRSVAIYCTHSDESYVPTSGTESKHGGGDILEVATAMVEVLEDKGIPVIHSDNIHDPHDVNAYQRSRKTAAELLQDAPAAIIDVHRDGIPDPAYYATELDGQPATQIRLVVGRQNQNSEANIAFAEKMKAYYDEVKPGLIKSVFMAKGNYNQDLAPHSVLLEVGTHTNTLEQAKTGAREFAEVLPTFLGLASATEQVEQGDGQQEAADAPTAQEKGGVGRAILWLVLIAVVGAGAFILISRGTGR